MRAIAQAGTGILLYEQQQGRGIGLMAKLRAYELQDQGLDTVEALEAVGIRVVERISAEVEPLESFERYVQVKQDKMGHIIDRAVPELG